MVASEVGDDLVRDTTEGADLVVRAPARTAFGADKGGASLALRRSSGGLRRVKVHQGYRFALDATVHQRRALASHCGAARFAFNFGLLQVRQTLEAREWERRLLETTEGLKALRRSRRRLRRLQRTVSRRRKGSARRRRARWQLARAHRRVADLRRDSLHKLTTRLAKSHGTVVVEDLNVRGMTRSVRGSVEKPGRGVRAKAGLNRALLDASLGELRRQLAFKCPRYGSLLMVADRFFASSKRCSGCGAVRARLRLTERLYRCADCGLVLDRDLNAAHNLVWWAETQRLRRHVAASAAETQNGREGGRAIRSCAGDAPGAAATGNVPEPAGSTGGSHQRVSHVRC